MYLGSEPLPDYLWMKVVDAFRYDLINQQVVRTNWLLGSIALFLHGIVDPAVTYVSIEVFSVGIETNQWLSGYIHQSAIAFILIYIPLFILVIGSLFALTWLFAKASPAETRQLHKLSLVVWIGIILWGAVVVANNLLVLITGVI